VEEVGRRGAVDVNQSGASLRRANSERQPVHVGVPPQRVDERHDDSTEFAAASNAIVRAAELVRDPVCIASNEHATGK